jgi:hypothetical protein
LNKIEAGLSGCILEIRPNNIIRKRASNYSYGVRLQKQAEKQELFYELNLPNLKTPKVIQMLNEEVFAFDMEYIPAAGFFDFFKAATPDNVDSVLETLFTFLDHSLEISTKSNCNTALIEKLINLNQYSEYKDLIRNLLSYCENNVLIIPKNFCHGDLNMSNMLFKNNNVYFIDFLDSYLESSIIDLVKLKQDLVHFWNMKITDQEKLRIKIIFEYIWSKIYRKYQNHIDHPSFKIIECVNFLRIEPYLQNNKQRNILEMILKGLQP